MRLSALEIELNGLEKQDSYIKEIKELDDKLTQHFENVLKNSSNITRKLVSFQANKTRATYRWFKYKEAFSADLVEYLLKRYSVPQGKILDPFAGAGTALFASSNLGYDSDGIEILPIGHEIVETRKFLLRELPNADMDTLKKWRDQKPWEKSGQLKKLNILRITDGAYPKDVESDIGRFLFQLESISGKVACLLKFTLLCVLESISFTRKDGQYLRWDYRAERRRIGNKFNKGKILSFGKAITEKLSEIIIDLENPQGINQSLFNAPIVKKGKINLEKGSCLNILPKLKGEQYNAIITSPPYCNRYDYTRTYALELALIGVNEQRLVDLRQNMISCTVENRVKELTKLNKKWGKAISVSNNLTLLQRIIDYLEYQKLQKKLNNNGIPRMIRGYFYEMACVIQECSRVLKENGFMFMVNDNVRYAAVPISVDLILSKIAESLGFVVERIIILPQAKGNSSQQMGVYGKFALRKCVYVWRKTS